MFNKLFKQKPEEKVYKSYVLKAGKKSISYKEFKKIWNNVHTIIKENLDAGFKSPYVVSKIDKSYVLYVSVRSTGVVINIWTNDEYQALTGTSL